MVVPQVILNFKWSIQIKKATLTNKNSNFKWIDICFDIGGGAPLQRIKVNDPTSDLHVAFQGGLHASTCGSYKWCQFQSIGSVHQKWKFKIQSSTPLQLFASSHKRFSWYNLQVVFIDLHMAQISYGVGSFMVIDDKGGEIWTKV